RSTRGTARPARGSRSSGRLRPGAAVCRRRWRICRSSTRRARPRVCSSGWSTHEQAAHLPPLVRRTSQRACLGSWRKRAKRRQAIAGGLEDVAEVEPWTTTFNPGRSTLDRLVELSQEGDFAAVVFAHHRRVAEGTSNTGALP